MKNTAPSTATDRLSFDTSEKSLPVKALTVVSCVLLRTLLLISRSLADVMTAVLSIATGEMYLFLSGRFQKWHSLIDFDGNISYETVLVNCSGVWNDSKRKQLH